MDDLSFLADAPQGNTTVVIQAADGSTTLPGLWTEALQKASPRLYDNLAVSDTGLTVTLSFKESGAAAICLLRFLYLEDYLLCPDAGDRPCSLLLHMHMVSIGERYQLPQLELQAKLNLMQELERSCYVNQPPLGLIEAIQYLVLELDNSDDIKETVANYCVGCLKYHNLLGWEAFRQIIFQAPQFHRLLLHVNIKREFDVEGAPELIQMLTCQHPVHSSSDREAARAASFLCHFHSGFGVNPGDVEQAPRSRASSVDDEFVLVQRPAVNQNAALQSPEKQTLVAESWHQALAVRPSRLDENPEEALSETSSFVVVGEEDAIDEHCQDRSMSAPYKPPDLGTRSV